MYQQADSSYNAIANAYATHYPNHYPSQLGVPLSVPGTQGLATSLSYFPSFQAQPSAPTAPAPSDPPEPAVTPKVASDALARLVTLELQNAGFEKAEQPALDRLQLEASMFIQQLFRRAHEYANLANRARAIATDVAEACEDFDLPTIELYQVKMNTSKRKRRPKTSATTRSVDLLKSQSRSLTPDQLSSDDEENSTPGLPAMASSLNNLPNRTMFPELPPKHTYRQTPASPPKKAALPSLEKKLKTAALVQESLQSLLTATEDSMNQDDAELLGHIVNWETNVQPRKRWRVKAK